MSSGIEKAAHIAEVIAIPIALIAVVVTGFQTQESLKVSKSALDETRKGNVQSASQAIEYQGTALCEAYREQVIDLHLLGYTIAEIRQTFLGEHADITKPATEVNNVYDRFYVPECGSVEIIAKRLTRPAPPQLERP